MVYDLEPESQLMIPCKGTNPNWRCLIHSKICHLNLCVFFWVQGHSTLRQEGQLEACQSFFSTLIAGLRLDISVDPKDKLFGVFKLN